MVRSLVQWTKTLSFPARISPNKSSKESVISPTLTPTPSNNSLSSPCSKNEFNIMKNNSMNEVNKVSFFIIQKIIMTNTTNKITQKLFFLKFG